MADDLVSLVLTLRPFETASMPAHLGRAAYALLLRLIDAVDPALAESLHSMNSRKPITCSTLVGPQPARGERWMVAPDNVYWMRFTAYAPTPAAALLQIHDDPPEEVEIDNVTFSVRDATVNPDHHPWADVTTYQALTGAHRSGKRPLAKRVTLEFVSPTAFRSGGKTVPIPLPDLVFGSLADCWNSFSPEPVDPAVRAFAGEHVAISGYRLRTLVTPAKDRSYEIGCVGRVTYSILADDEKWRGVLHMLARYAFFVGVGYQTTAGLGQARTSDQRLGRI